MCGIVGYVGEQRKINYLFESLKKLEYRGYDSAGLAYFSKSKFSCIKSVGNMDKLKEKLNLEESFSCGIGHTRWATNGAVLLGNTHPHISLDGEWTIVHNGIIENAEELKKECKIETRADTDTEIVANLLSKEEGTSLERIKKVCDKLKGSWAFLILNRRECDRIYLAKKRSPIYFCKGESGVLISSDPICFDKSEYFSISDRNIAEIKKDEIAVYDANLKLKQAKRYYMKNYEKRNEKGQYAHFMLKEIKETSSRLKKISNTYSEEFLTKVLGENILKKVSFIKIIGCGSAYHSALMGAYYLRKNTGIEAEGYLASEFKTSNQIISVSDLYIFVTQSGETADTIECLKLVKKRGVKTIVLTNVMESSITKLSRRVLPICAGPEIAVASTKAYTCQVAAFFLLARYLRSQIFKDVDFEKEKKKLKKAAEKLRRINDQKIKKVDICCEKVFFLGKGNDYITSMEASLKFKEITYLNSQSCAIGELKHGSLAVIDENSQCFVFISNRKLSKKALNGVNEIISRRGNVILVSPYKDLTQKSKYIKEFNIDCRNVSDELTPLIFAVFAQYLAYYVCIGRNLNPDQPRNLAKSVTVE